MKISGILLLIALSQVTDSVTVFKNRYSYEKDNFDSEEILNSVIKKEMVNKEKIVLLERKLGFDFFNIENLLMTYSFSKALNINDEEKKEIESLFVSISDELIVQQYPVIISVGSDERGIKKFLRQNRKNGNQFAVNLIQIKKTDFIKKKNVEHLLEVFNNNTLSKF